MPPRSSSPRLAAIRSDGESVRRGPSLSCSGAPTLPWSHEATTLSSLAYVYSTTGFGIRGWAHSEGRSLVGPQLGRSAARSPGVSVAFHLRFVAGRRPTEGSLKLAQIGHGLGAIFASKTTSSKTA